MFLKEGKYVVKEKKIPTYIIDNTKISSDSGRKNCDEESPDEENSDEKKFNEENSNEKNFNEENYKKYCTY